MRRSTAINKIAKYNNDKRRVLFSCIRCCLRYVSQMVVEQDGVRLEIYGSSEAPGWTNVIGILMEWGKGE